MYITNPTKYLWRCLPSHDMKTALFLGAGASVFAEQPTTRELMDLVRERVDITAEAGRNMSDIVRIIVKDDLYTDVEKLYDGIDQMWSIRDNIPNTKPIFNTLHANGDTFKNTLNELKRVQSIIRDVLLESFDTERIIPDSVRRMYDMVWSVMKDDEVDERHVFTTNYDLVVETYANVCGFELVNGFKPYRYWSGIWGNMWESNTSQPPLHLIKLHGSVNWHRNNGKIMETGGVVQRDTDDDIIIVPTEGTKNYGKDPFPDLMDRFKESIKHVDILLIIGFSYRDDKIVDIIKDRIAEGMILISVSPTTVEDIQQVSEATPQAEEIDGMSLKVVKSRIILCERRFQPETLEDMRAVMNAAYGLARRLRGEKSSDIAS